MRMQINPGTLSVLAIAMFMLLLAVPLSIPLAGAALAWVTPASGSNNSVDIYMVVSYVNGTDITTPTAEFSSLLENSSGSFVDVSVSNEALNITAWNATLTITTLLDATGYTFNVTFGNGTLLANVSVVLDTITIDDTNPTATCTISGIGTYTTVGSTVDISWIFSDATSGLETVNTTITSPDSQRCATQRFETTSEDIQYTGSETTCTGTYTCEVNATDYAGNNFLTTSTFQVRDAGSAGGLGLGVDKDKDAVPTGVIVVIIALIFIYFLSRKK